MSRQKRMAAVTRLAVEAEERARAGWLMAAAQLQSADVEREAVLERASQLGEQDLPVGLRGLLVSTGANYLSLLSQQKTELTQAVVAAQTDLEAAVVRLRSLERVAERAERAEQAERQRVANADMSDLVSIRAGRNQS